MNPIQKNKLLSGRNLIVSNEIGNLGTHKSDNAKIIDNERINLDMGDSVRMDDFTSLAINHQ